MSYKDLITNKPEWVDKNQFFYLFKVEFTNYFETLDELDENKEIRSKIGLNLKNKESKYYLVSDLEKFYEYRNVGKIKRSKNNKKHLANDALQRARQHSEESEFKTAKTKYLPKVDLGLKPIVKNYIKVA